MAITDLEYESLNKILSDPEQAVNLSLEQLKQTGALIQEYEAEQAEFRQRLVDKGFTDKDIATLDRAKEGVTKNTGGPGFSPVTKLQARGIKQGAQEAAIGALDLAEDIAVVLHGQSEEHRVQWKAGLKEFHLKNAINNMEEFGQLPSPASEMLGTIGVFLAALPAAAENMTTLVVKRVIQGGFLGAATEQEAGKTLIDRAFNSVLGASIGLASTTLSIKDAIAKQAGKSFVKAFNETDGKQRELVQMLVQEMTDNPEFQLSLAQVSGGRFALGLEIGAASQKTKAAQNKNIWALVKNILKLSRAQSSKGATANDIAKSLRTTLKTARDSIYKAASTRWQAKVNNIAGEFGDDVAVQGDLFLAKVDKLVAEQANKLLTVGAKPSQALIAYRNLVDIAVNPVVVRTVKSRTGKLRFVLFDRKNGTAMRFEGTKRQAQAKMLEINSEFGGLTGQEAIDVIGGLNNLIGGNTIIFENATASSNRTMGRALMGAMTSELNSKGGNELTKKAIKELTQQYTDDMAKAQAIDDTVVAALFGGKKLPKKPGKALDALMKNEQPDLSHVREFLEEWNEPLLHQLRRTHLRRVITGAPRAGQPDVDIATSLPKLANRLSDGFSRAGQAGKGIHTAATQAELVLTAKALRVIANKYFTGITPGGIKVEEIAINLISRAPEFMARFLTRALSSGQGVEEALLNPSFRKALIDLSKAPIKGTLTTSGKAAMVFMAEWINVGDQITARNAQSERERASLEAQSAVPIRAQTAQ